MKLSVIILNYNVRYFLELCVLSVQNAIQGIDAEIIIVDNDSQDDSCEMIMQRFPDIILIKNKQNLGFPKGNNIGVAAAKGEYICILNPDTVVAEDTFEKVLVFAESRKDMGITGVKLIDGTGNFLPESKRGIPTPFVAFTKIAGLYKFFPGTFGKYYASHLSENETGKIDILVGAFMLMKRQLYIDIGGFDEDCFMYSDDVDLSYMVLKTGRSNYYYHDTTVIHYKGESTIKDRKYMERFQQAMHFFYKKHFRVPVLFSLFMKVGIVFFSIVKMFQGKQRPNPEEYILVSDSELLREEVGMILNKNIVLQDWDKQPVLMQTFSKRKHTQIIFDTNYVGFKFIIEAFENNKSKYVTYRIISQLSDFLIGSDSSFDRGEVVKLSDLKILSQGIDKEQKEGIKIYNS